MTELKPCPFCGGKANVNMKIISKNDFSIYVSCSKCRARTDGYCPTVTKEECALESIEKCKALAIEKWNRRVNEDVD